MSERPFLPDDIRVDRSLTRAATAIALGALQRGNATELAAQSWPRDRAATALVRAATSGGGVTGWGGELAAGTAVSAFVAGRPGFTHEPGG